MGRSIVSSSWIMFGRVNLIVSIPFWGSQMVSIQGVLGYLFASSILTIRLDERPMGTIDD